MIPGRGVGTLKIKEIKPQRAQRKNAEDTEKRFSALVLSLCPHAFSASSVVQQFLTRAETQAVGCGGERA
jgi:hypothetical protein